MEEESRIEMGQKLRVAIDCRIADYQQGIGTAVFALAKALSDSDAENQEYTFIVREKMKDLLAPYVYGPCKLEGISESKLSKLKTAFRWIAPLRFLWRKLTNATAGIPVSDGYVDLHRFDVVHFPTQIAYRTELPTIYQPWDLQHLHYPQFFPQTVFAQREREYRDFCNRAVYVCVQTEWTRQDIIRHYGLAEEKVVVIPWGSVFDAYRPPSTEDVRAATNKYHLPGSYFFYPAVTWPHKNHEVILRALHILKRDNGIVPHILFTGASSAYRQTLDKLAQELGVSEQLHFLGFVTPTELQVIFKTATAMIFPSKFEGFGLPILEAFHTGLPVLSSNSTTLPEVARDAALYFDPDSSGELSALMKRILDTPVLRQEMIRKGTLILSQYSIQDTVARFQELYERTAALPAKDSRRSPELAAIR
jgi:glycosyltransferase involved in cell wall biosynthesis